MIRRFGESIISHKRYRMRPGAYAILIERDQILVTWQEQPRPELQLPGGGIDPGESVLNALHREVIEETGWRICAPRRLGAFRRFTYMPEYDMWAEKLCHIYLARPARQVGPPSEPFHTAVWMRAEHAANQLAVDGDRHFLGQYLSRTRP